MSNSTLGFIAIISFLLAAFYTGCETAFIASDRIRIRHLSNRGNKGAKMVMRYLENPEFFLSAVIGTNISVIGCTATFTAILTSHYGESGSSIATGILVPFFLVFGEMIPKGVFLYYADRAIVLCAYPLRFLSFLLYPLIKASSFAAEVVLKLFRMKDAKDRMRLSMEELLFHLESSKEAGIIPEETMKLALRAYELKKLRARDVMLPLDKVKMVEEGLPIEAYKSSFTREGFSRFPVYSKSRENIVGILSIHNLIRAGSPQAGRLEIESPYFVPMDAPIVRVLFEMKNRGCHMALIHDKMKKVAGMTTLEDILERLVGTIADEFH